MRVRSKKTGSLGEATDFNIHGLGEIVVYFDEGDCSSEFFREYEVQLTSGEWKDMRQAFVDHDLIPNDLNTSFRESRSDAECAQGWY
jgi:hypothetical protein